MHETMEQFRKHIEMEGSERTAESYAMALQQYHDWLLTKEVDPLRATTEDVKQYQRWLAEEYQSPRGSTLALNTQANRLACVKSYYRWLERKGLILADISRKVSLPKIRRSVTSRDHLTLQEVTAILQTQMKRSTKFVEGSFRWAREIEGLCLLSLAVACGRRRRALLHLRTSDLNFERNEIRIEHEKGKAGRVVPVAQWAMTVAKKYVESARPILNWYFENTWLFVGERSPQMSASMFSRLLHTIRRETVKHNPDLEELTRKHLTPHCLRVSFATLLFKGGCNIRSINELMDHENLTTTARYIPLQLEDLRRVCQNAHPRS